MRLHGGLRPEHGVQLHRLWGRYAYANQPAAAGWNLARFAETLLPLIDDDTERAIELAQATLGSFADRCEAARLDGMRAKLGLTARVDDAVVTALAGDLLDLLHTSHVDYTSFFVDLGGPPAAMPNPPAGCSSIWPDSMRG